MQSLANHDYLNGRYSVFDYGCGKGDDLRELQAHGIKAIGWDPVYLPQNEKQPSDIDFSHYFDKPASNQTSQPIATPESTKKIMRHAPAMRHPVILIGFLRVTLVAFVIVINNYRKGAVTHL